MSLKQSLLEDRLASYARLRGGYSVPLAGAVYWAALGGAGYVLELRPWILAAFYASGLIFPLAVVLSKLLRNDFMKDKSASDTVLFPAFVGMLLFWPMAFAALGTAPELVPLILAVGMSAHWPVIGWSYARTALYSAHAIVRAIAVTAIWITMPDARTTLLPFAVAIIYLLTIVAVLIDSGLVRRKLASAVAA